MADFNIKIKEEGGVIVVPQKVTWITTGENRSPLFVCKKFQRARENF